MEASRCTSCRAEGRSSGSALQHNSITSCTSGVQPRRLRCKSHPTTCLKNVEYLWLRVPSCSAPPCTTRGPRLPPTPSSPCVPCNIAAGPVAACVAIMLRTLQRRATAAVLCSSVLSDRNIPDLQGAVFIFQTESSQPDCRPLLLLQLQGRQQAPSGGPVTGTRGAMQQKAAPAH